MDELWASLRVPFAVLLTADGQREEGDFILLFSGGGTPWCFVDRASKAVFPFQQVRVAMHGANG